MDKVAATCSICARGIPLADLESQRALTLLKRRYCRHCTTMLDGARPKPPASLYERLTQLIMQVRGGP